jgi:hypothetical protein
VLVSTDVPARLIVGENHMTPRRTSRRPRRRQQIEENLVDKVRLAEFKADFAHEITQICNLAPLKARPDLIDDFLLTLDEIVGLARRRLDVDQKERVIESIRASKDAADKIPAIAAALRKMDAQQLENILSIAIEVCPRPFLKNKGPLQIFHLATRRHDASADTARSHSVGNW